MLTLRNFTYADPYHPWYKRAFIKGIERITGQYRLWRLYREYQTEDRGENSNFWDTALDKLEITLDYNADALKATPKSGPLVIVANHPFGVIDGLAIASLTHKIRGDYKILTNSVLCKADEVADYVLPVDFSPAPDAWKTNLESRQKARAILKLGGCLVVFPAGGVSTIQNKYEYDAWDQGWQPFVASLILGNEANVLPIYFEGQNSRLFQLASLYSQSLRLALFFREVRKRIGATLKVKIGQVVKYDELAVFKTRDDLNLHLWRKVYGLSERKNLPEPLPPYRLETPKRKKDKRISPI